MRLLRALMALQASKGVVSDEDLEVLEPAAMINDSPVGGAVADIRDYATGAQRGIIYLRHEYVHAAQILEQAIARAYAAGALGENIFGSGFSFDLEVFVSPGGYILGEETALLEALEDKRGEPRNKPPFPTNAGLHGKPTLINNVETFAAVPAICLRGADWWAEQGKPGFKGLKDDSVSGDVASPGVHCVPCRVGSQKAVEMVEQVLAGEVARTPMALAEPSLSPDLPDEEFALHSQHRPSAGTLAHRVMTRRSEALDAIAPEAYVEIHPADAVQLNVRVDDLVKISSRRGSVRLKAKLTDTVAPKTVFIPMHFS